MSKENRVYFPHWVVGLLIKVGIPISITVSGAAFGMVFDMWQTVNTLEKNDTNNNARMVELEEFMGQGPRVTTDDLDERAGQIATVYAKTIENQSKTLNEVLVIQRQNTILLNRIDERASGLDKRIERIEDRTERSKGTP